MTMIKSNLLIFPVIGWAFGIKLKNTLFGLRS
jgi:hypothetical protein